MLKRLSIQNYALIDQLELNFRGGLNIITGETGAGKSILLGALALILGQRADSSSLLDSSRKSIVEGEFNYDESHINFYAFFKENELDIEKSIVLRREITAEGKSRSFINDTPVNLQLLRELGSLLIDVHSQHETLLLNRAEFQLSTLDAFAGVQNEVGDYRKDYQNYTRKLRELDDLLNTEKKAKADQDYFQFQFTELDEAMLQIGEQENLEEELQTLSHAEEIRSGLNAVDNLISLSEDNLLQKVHQAELQIRNLSSFHQQFNALADRLRSTEIELKDISGELESLGALVVLDPSRLEIVNDRLNQIYRLEQKHRLSSVEALIRLRDEFNAKLSGIGTLEAQILIAENECKELKSELLKKSEKISHQRKTTIPELEQKIKKLLKEVGMPNAILKIENLLLPDGEIGPSGRDSIRFLFSANKGVAYSDLSKVASGGELSRLMLCLKSSVAKLIELPTLIFDEIDTGVSGETAFKIGNLMQDMSARHQLIVITHLPQIAGRGDSHFFVYKEVLAKKTFTRVKSLTREERVMEVARMISGDKPTAVSMANAKELMKA